MNINNDISENYVSIEVAKLLKVKGFHVPTIYHYGETNGYISIGSDIPATDWNKDHDDHMDEVQLYSRPTQTVAIEWIRINFGHDVESRGVRYAGDEKSTYYQSYVDGCVISMKKFNTPKESIDAGLQYVLHSLITTRL